MIVQSTFPVVLLFVGSLIGFGSVTYAQQSPPNVLFIMSDDLANLLGAYGDPLAKTPNLDQLAARGLRFDRAYCAFPLCGPSRNAMLTGLYPNSNGILRNGQIFRQTIPTHCSLPQAFRLSGYVTARVGKLYHYNVPNSIGTDGHDDPASWEIEANPAGVDRLQEHPKIKSLIPNQFGGTLSWYASPAEEGRHTDSLLADDAVWMLERFAVKRDRPFFLSVGLFRPHTPYVAPDKYFKLFDQVAMPVVQGVEEDRQDIPAPALASGKKEQDAMSDDLRREVLQAYYASISFMDAQVGRMIQALDRLKLTDNTIIVFTSDHGYHTGQHGLWQKMSLFEESARVPLLIIAPGVTKPGSAAKTPVSQVDIYPTLAELAGLSKPSNLQGQSLVPILKDPNSTGRGWAITQVTRGNEKNGEFFGYTLRNSRYRYTEWDGGKRGRELYDHESDPLEKSNLAEKSELKPVVDELSLLLAKAVASTKPASGMTPALKPNLWAPTLTEIDE
jgi:arylsulfatase A-like enzyme